MKIIFLGIMFCDEALNKAYSEVKHGFSLAPHIFQDNLLKGFEAIDGVDVEVINIPPTGSFPINNKKLYSKEYYWGKNNHQVGYFNIHGIKRSIQTIKIRREIDSKLRQISDRKNVFVIAYSAYEPFLDILHSVKAKYPDVSLCLIQTDPIMGRGERAKYMTPSAVREGNRIVKKAKCVDKFVLLTKYLAEALEVGERPYTVIECICNSEQPEAKIGRRKNICLYTGTLNEEFGIKELADAFKLIDNGELWICGDGETKDYISEQAAIHSNIRYLGYLDRAGIREKQDECDFLINPRRPSGTYTMYSFPSKTAEYMMTGKPAIMYKLEGIPDEYDGYLNYLRSAEPSEIAAELNHIFNDLDYYELLCKAQSGRRFMLAEKSNSIQAQKICSLLVAD